VNPMHPTIQQALAPWVTPKLAQVPADYWPSEVNEAQRKRLDALMLRTKQNPQPHIDRLARQEANVRRLQGEVL